MERDVVKVCLEYLNHIGIFAMRQNTGAFMGEYEGKKRFMRFGTRGQSDILGIAKPNGRFIAVECKSERGKLSLDQEQYLQRIKDFGGIAIVARSLDDLIGELDKYGYTIKTRRY